MEKPAGIRSRNRRSSPALLLSVLVFISSSDRCLRSSAAVCNTTRTSFRVENLSDARELNAAVNCSDGGQLEAVWAGTVVLDAPIVIRSGTFLSIKGEGQQAEAQGGLSTHMFSVISGGGLTITELTLSGGAARIGGAIHALVAKLTLVRCVFEGNVANVGGGGAVFVSGGEVNITGGDFRRNNATGYGGAVFTNNAELVVQDGATFEQNMAAAGGALYSKGQPCSLSNASFVSNKACDEAGPATSGDDDDSKNGGAAAFDSAVVTIADSYFAANFAESSGGALWGGPNTLLTVDGCTFWNNTTPKAGGAISASNATVGGGTELRYNFADEDGGAIYGWDPSGNIELWDITCDNNTATESGGCFNTHGRGIVTNGTVMNGNVAYAGGCIYASSGCNITVEGGNFTCHATRNGGFLFASDGGRVEMTGGLVSNNVAERKGGAVYCSGESGILSPLSSGGSKVFIEGGTFVGNNAREVGGAVMVWGPSTVVSITGGIFERNYATFFGGFIFVELEASLVCDGATIEGNYAGGQGGGIYARDATWVNSSCGMINNESPQGAAVYLTHVGSATFENTEITGNTVSSGSAMYIAESSVVATRVTLESKCTSQDESTSRAIQMDGSSTLVGQECVFNGWLGDTVIYNSNPTNGSLVLDSCDFSGTSTAMAVISPNSDAEIRNAVVGDQTIMAADTQDPLKLVDRALECADPNACGADGECVDSALGVLCECLPQSGECLDDGGTISLTLKNPPDPVTHSPDPVAFELLVSAAEDGTTDVIWELEVKADKLSLTILPCSGILHPGGNATIAVTGTPLQEEVGGNMTNHFSLTSVGSSDDGMPSSQTTSGMSALNVTSEVYLCRASQYAFPGDVDDVNDEDVNFECRQCVEIEGSEGVNCDLPGVTLASLPIREGYWRSSNESRVVHPCLNSAACAGATEVSSSDDYCADGYEGPYCAVCTETYGQGVGRVCHSCENTTTKGRLLVASGMLCSIVVLLFLLVVVVFLVGGLDAVGNVRRSVASLPVFSSGTARPLRRFTSSKSARLGPSSVSTAGAAKVTSISDKQGSFPFVGGAISPIEIPARTVTDAHSDAEATRTVTVAHSDAEAMALDSRSPMTLIAAGGKMIDSSRADSTHFDAQASSSHGVQPSRSTHLHANTADGDIGDNKRFCGGFGAKMKRWTSRVPWNKMKILVVVWQIITVFPSIAGVDYPPTYSRFLSVIDVVNLDLGHFFSASCLLPYVTFYERLLATTLVPMVLAGVLVGTYQLAKRRAGTGWNGAIARSAAWSRHTAAWLLSTFLVFTSASTVVFKTFACDESAVEGESYLREDYRLSCKSSTHTYFMIYAGFMVLVYPVGIPLLYFFILWQNRHLLNPSVRAKSEGAEVHHPADESAIATTNCPVSISQEKERELEERVKMRKRNPDLVPSMFLWKDFGPDLYYYEVIECGRRMLLTGVLIFVAPHSPAQTAMACIFAFASLLGFELLRPHLDSTDAWLYRAGCVVIFLNNFVGLLIQVDAPGQDNRDVLGGLLVAINVFLVLTVLVTSWFATQQRVDECQEQSILLSMTKTVVVPGVISKGPSKIPRRGISARSNFDDSP